jgi:hypothetical protein
MSFVGMGAGGTELKHPVGAGGEEAKTPKTRQRNLGTGLKVIDLTRAHEEVFMVTP